MRSQRLLTGVREKTPGKLSAFEAEQSIQLEHKSTMQDTEMAARPAFGSGNHNARWCVLLWENLNTKVLDGKQG
ncbi:MAG: hypothetical protein MK102_15890 [Fuerstiella sp.]|nr:hypothetical protein [Fuerstiella sp.]